MSEINTEEKDTTEGEIGYPEPSAARSFIAMFDNAVDEDVCDRFISLFDDETITVDNIDSQNLLCSEIVLLQEQILNADNPVAKLTIDLLQNLQYYSEAYRQFFNIGFFPERASTDNMWLRKFDSKKESFQEYTSDVLDLDTSKRFLSIIVFLNDVFEGGQVVFPDYNIGAKPQKGSILIYPSSWTHPNFQQTPMSNDQFVLKTHLQYI